MGKKSTPKDVAPEFKLDINERITLMNSLPKEGNFVQQTICKALTAELEIGVEEMEKISMTTVGMGQDSRLQWDEKKAKPKKIKVRREMHNVIEEALKKLDSENKLTRHHISLYEKFVETT